MLSVSGLKRAVVFLITVYVSVPVLLYLFPWILTDFIFSHMLRFPLMADLSRPENFLNHTRNFYLHAEEGVTLGVWHTLAASQWEEAQGGSPEWYRETLGDDNPVIIYLHGNEGTRAREHRVGLVKILSAAGYHVLSLDYRGFGDSSGEPSEAGLTTDVVSLYQWVRKYSGQSPVYLWGHSLGTGVATNAAVKLQEQGSDVDAVILQAPYTRIGELIIRHRIVKLYRFFPGFESLIWNILEMNDMLLANDNNLKTLTCPLLLLHAKDDSVVPYQMGVKLYQIALETQRERNKEAHVQLISYSADLGYSHSSIYLDPNLSHVVREFLQNL